MCLSKHGEGFAGSGLRLAHTNVRKHFSEHWKNKSSNAF
jgi:hypothetical protein